MAWYYAEGDKRVGPLNDADFEAAVARGKIEGETLVWREGMKAWALFSTTGFVPGASSGPARSGTVVCAECGRSFPADEVIAYAGKYVCGGCKAIFFQRVKEGGALPGEFTYGGFWIRFGARFLDGIILYVCSLAIQIPISSSISPGGEPGAAIRLQLIAFLIQFLLGMAYPTFFNGRFGATPGKMAAGLKIVRPDGASITYLRAFGRYFAEMLSSIIFLIGYIMAAFDEEKRALHDRICDTRVIRTR